jgi:hypothetical protein
VREAGFAVRPQRDNASRHADPDILSGKFLRGTSPESLDNLPGSVRPIELVRVSRLAKSFNFCQFLASLQVLIERLKFQGEPFWFSGKRLKQAARQYIDPVRKASRNGTSTGVIMRRFGG